ncbi:response regulator [Myxococcota bacterium]|nr:response regulator [Myxococcota bacterium]MBU1429304.1 response regulator [Myxococcota bacterium]MBU1899310.1 response regulator [Myxococcota bacterium]
MNPTHVLLVDDDEDFLLQMELQLKAKGYSVCAADGLEAADACLAQRAPDVAIIDLMMAQMDDGLVLARRIKARYPSVPVIMVTGVAHEAGLTFERGPWVKADLILDKPVRFEQIERALSQVLR